MITAETLRLWQQPPAYAAVLDQRLALRREHRRLERAIHGRNSQ